MVTMSGNVAVILNPASGKGRAGAAAPVIMEGFAVRGIGARILTGTDAEDALRLAREAVADGVDALVAAGGDGTINLAVQAVANTETPLGIISLGTGNDNARLLHLPRKDPDGAIDIIARWRPRSVDLASVTTADGVTNYFLGVLSAGFDSLVTERANTMTWPPGEARYLRALLTELRTFEPVEFTITIDGVTTTDRGMLAAVGNGVSYGGGMRVCEGAEVDDGLLMLTWLHESSKFHFVRTFPSVYQGTHIQDDKVTQHVGREIRIEAADQLAYADGERMGPLPIDVAVHPGALKVLSA